MGRFYRHESNGDDSARSFGLEAFSVSEAAENLQLTQARVRQLLQENAMPGAYKFSERVWVIPRESLEKFMNKRYEESNGTTKD
jgi:excisionase family DNA binding protein